MPRPSLTTRVEKPNSTVCDWIMGVSIRAFKTIARTAGKPEILFIIGAAAG